MLKIKNPDQVLQEEVVKIQNEEGNDRNKFIFPTSTDDLKTLVETINKLIRSISLSEELRAMFTTDECTHLDCLRQALEDAIEEDPDE